MNYQNIVDDFVHRTRLNLEYIEKHANDPDTNIYETTQLINSMLGLLIFPEQRYYNHIPKIAIQDMVSQGWPEIKPTRRIIASPDFKDCEHLQDLMRYLRNSISHFNIKFITNENNEITGIKVWNINTTKPDRPITWEADISLEDLRIITMKFIELMTNSKPG